MKRLEANQFRSGPVIALAVALLGLSAPVRGAGPSTALDPDAVAVPKKATTYLAGIESLSVKGHGTLEVVLVNGQKLQLAGRIHQNRRIKCVQ